MTMRLLAFFLPFLLLACSCTPAPVPTPFPQPELRHVVALVHEDGGAYCSGVSVRQGILTAAHCVDGQEGAYVALYDSFDPDLGSWSRATYAAVLRRSEADDLALLDYRPLWFASVALVQPGVGTPVFAVGHPGGLGYLAHRGVVSSEVRHSFDGPRAWFFTDAGVFPGMSGGGLFNDYGELVGIHSFVLAGAMGLLPLPHLGGCVATEAIHDFLEE